MGAAGVRHQDVQPAEPLDGGRDQPGGASGSVTSAGIARTSPGNSAAVASNFSGFRAQMATRAPSRDIASAAPRPSPFDAAVTSATFPDIPRSIVEMLRRRGLGRRTEARPRRTLVAMSFRRLLPLIAACAAVVALVVTCSPRPTAGNPDRPHPRCGRTRTSPRSRAWACGSTSTTARRGPTRRQRSPTWPSTACTRCTWRPRTSTGRSRSWTSRAWRRSSTRRTSTGSKSWRGTSPGSSTWVSTPSARRRRSGSARMRATGSTDSRWTSRRRMSPTPACGRHACWTSRTGCGRSPARAFHSAASSRRRAGSWCTRTTGRGSRTRTSPPSTT